MSLLHHDRITVKPFAMVPALDDLPAIDRGAPSVSNVSSHRGIEDDVDLEEGCLVTKTIDYTHQLGHWVNAVRRGDPDPIEDFIEDRLRIIPGTIEFELDHPCNLAFLEARLHTALDLYAFIAVTATLSNLDSLINMVQADNDLRQQAINNGDIRRRFLNFELPSFTNPDYELVALHPEHFLPRGRMLTVYDPSTVTYKHYVAAVDRCLRETSDPGSPRLPVFQHVCENRSSLLHLNVFLVILNAEIKFHRYLKMIQQQPPPTPLPPDVINLMRRTIELVDLLYWEPVPPKKGSKGAKILASRQTKRRKNPASDARPPPGITIELSEEMIEDGQVMQIPSGSHTVPSRRKALRREWREMDFETRRAYGTALMSGHDREYDPALFEDAFPINESHLYSEPMAIDAWQQDIISHPSETSAD